MTDVSRPEMDAKFETAAARADAHEARTEAKYAELVGKIDGLATTVEGLAESFRDFRGEVREEFRDVRAEVRSDNKNTRWTVAVTTIAAVLAAVAAIWTSQANLLAAFRAGLARQQAVSSSPSSPEPARKASLADAR